MSTVYCYIDGFNLYHAIAALQIPRYKWLDLRALASTYCGPDDSLARVMYFSALMKWAPQKQRRHKEYIRALVTRGVEPVLSKFQRSNKHCQVRDRYCDFWEEKQTDVGIAARMIGDVASDRPDKVILISADSDQVPAIATMRAMDPHLEVLVLCPPGRGGHARELRQVAHEFREIAAGALPRCILPRNVRDGRGTVVARAPAEYGVPDTRPHSSAATASQFGQKCGQNDGSAEDTMGKVSSKSAS